MIVNDTMKPFSLISAMTSEQKETNEFEPADAETGLGGNAREAIVNTSKASVYLQKMCRHFTHRVPAHWNAQQGKVFFDMGWCFMTATEQALKVRCEARSEAELDDILETLKRHFDRFALKDQLVLNWQ